MKEKAKILREWEGRVFGTRTKIALIDNGRPVIRKDTLIIYDPRDNSKELTRIDVEDRLFNLFIPRDSDMSDVVEAIIMNSLNIKTDDVDMYHKIQIVKLIIFYPEYVVSRSEVLQT